MASRQAKNKPGSLSTYSAPKLYKGSNLLHLQKNRKHSKNTQLVNFKIDEYICRAAKTIEETTQLIEPNFNYVTEINNIKLFRKLK